MHVCVFVGGGGGYAFFLFSGSFHNTDLAKIRKSTMCSFQTSVLFFFSPSFVTLIGLHPMLSFLETGLERREARGDGTLGLYSSKEGLFFQTSSWSPVTLAKMFWRYGWDIKRIQDWVAEMMDYFSK